LREAKTFGLERLTGVAEHGAGSGAWAESVVGEALVRSSASLVDAALVDAGTARPTSTATSRARDPRERRELVWIICSFGLVIGRGLEETSPTRSIPIQLTADFCLRSFAGLRTRRIYESRGSGRA
jgi:hypothetical protein